MSIQNARQGNSTTDIQDNVYTRIFLDWQTGGGTIAAGTTAYLILVEEGSSVTEESTVDFIWVAPRGGTMLGMGYGVTGAPGAGQTFDATLRQNKANFATNITVNLSGAGALRGSFSTNVAFSAGNKIGAQIVTSAGAAVSGHRVTALARLEE